MPHPAPLALGVPCRAPLGAQDLGTRCRGAKVVACPKGAASCPRALRRLLSSPWGFFLLPPPLPPFPAAATAALPQIHPSPGDSCGDTSHGGDTEAAPPHLALPPPAPPFPLSPSRCCFFRNPKRRRLQLPPPGHSMGVMAGFPGGGGTDRLAPAAPPCTPARPEAGRCPIACTLPPPLTICVEKRTETGGGGSLLSPCFFLFLLSWPFRGCVPPPAGGGSMPGPSPR